MSPQLIGSALDRVVNSKTFSRSRSLQDFLTFIVNHSLEPDQSLKEYRIGVDALNRGGAFDPAENSIVRVQAHRLRIKLADYYQHEGQTEDVRIDLEPGSYTPVIREGAVVATFHSLRFRGLIIDILPVDSGPASLFHHDISTRLDTLLRDAFRRHPHRSSRLHLQLDFSVRTGPWGLRAIVYLTDVDTRSVLLSQAVTEPPVPSLADYSRQALGKGSHLAEAFFERIEALLTCNG